MEIDGAIVGTKLGASDGSPVVGIVEGTKLGKSDGSTEVKGVVTESICGMIGDFVGNNVTDGDAEIDWVVEGTKLGKSDGGAEVEGAVELSTCFVPSAGRTL